MFLDSWTGGDQPVRPKGGAVATVSRRCLVSGLRGGPIQGVPVPTGQHVLPSLVPSGSAHCALDPIVGSGAAVGVASSGRGPWRRKWAWHYHGHEWAGPMVRKVGVSGRGRAARARVEASPRQALLLRRPEAADGCRSSWLQNVP